MKHTWYVRALSGEIILYLIWDKFFNFEVSISKLKIQVFWEITRVRNKISKVRTCKNKDLKINLFKGICTLSDFFFDAINSMAEEKKLDCNDPLKFGIKLQWASFFLNHRSWLMIEWIKKEGSSLELYLISSALRQLLLSFMSFDTTAGSVVF